MDTLRLAGCQAFCQRQQMSSPDAQGVVAQHPAELVVGGEMSKSPRQAPAPDGRCPKAAQVLLYSADIDPVAARHQGWAGLWADNSRMSWQTKGRICPCALAFAAMPSISSDWSLGSSW